MQADQVGGNGRIIVIGASAGGVSALLRLAPQLSPGLEAPILLVLHIGAHRSHIAELLSTKGPIRAVVARTGEIPEPGTIYVAPSDHHLLIEGGALCIVRGPKEHHARPAINPLFRSAALELGPRAVGVVLTGMLDDGAAGLRAIELCGGTTVVQDPEDAAEPSMPRSALAAVDADHVLPLDAMADLLNRLARPLPTVEPVVAPDWLRIEHAISMGHEDMQTLATIGDPSGFTCPDCGGALFELSEGRPVRFLCHTGHAFSLRALAGAQDQVADVALWAALRVVQEKEAILRRLAQAGDGAEHNQAALEEARALSEFAGQIRAAILAAPSSKAAEAVA